MFFSLNSLVCGHAYPVSTAKHLPGGEKMSRNMQSSPACAFALSTWSAKRAPLEHVRRPSSAPLAADQSFVAASIVATVLNVFSLSAFLQPVHARCFSKSQVSRYSVSGATSVVDAGDLLKHHCHEQVLERTARVRQCDVFCQVPIVRPWLLQDSILSWFFSETFLTETGHHARGSPAFGCCWPCRSQYANPCLMQLSLSECDLQQPRAPQYCICSVRITPHFRAGPLEQDLE